MGLSTVSVAAALPAKKIWSLPQLTDLALRLNPATQMAWAQVRESAANLGIVKSAYWPQLNLSVNGSLTTHDSTTQDSNDFGCSSDDPYCVNLGLNQVLLDFGLRRHQVESARYLLLSSQLSENESIQTVIYTVEQAYYGVLGQQALVHADQISLKEAQTNEAAATAMHDQGLSTIGDVYQAASTRAQAELSLQQAQGMLSIAAGQLAVAVGLPVETSLTLAPLPTAFNTARAMRPIQDLLDQAKIARPDLLAAQAQVNAAKANISAVQRTQWPTLALSINSARASMIASNTSINRQSNLMLTLNMPLFTGFQQRSQIQQAKAQETYAQASHDAVSNAVALSVWEAYYALLTAKTAINTSQAYLKTSIQAANQALGQYKAGVGNILSVLTTQTTEANARVQAIQSTLDWYLALAQLIQALGITTVSEPKENMARVSLD